jgi:PhnB protein
MPYPRHRNPSSGLIDPYERTVAGNAASLEEPADMPYGDRLAMVRDAWGNIWQIATHEHDL